jgi:hypothetical protein
MSPRTSRNRHILTLEARCLQWVSIKLVVKEEKYELQTVINILKLLKMLKDS